MKMSLQVYGFFSKTTHSNGLLWTYGWRRTVHMGSWMCLLAVREVDHSFQGVDWAAWLAEAEVSGIVTLISDQVLLSRQLKVNVAFSVVSIKHIDSVHVLSTNELPLGIGLVWLWVNSLTNNLWVIPGQKPCCHHLSAPTLCPAQGKPSASAQKMNKFPIKRRLLVIVSVLWDMNM